MSVRGLEELAPATRATVAAYLITIPHEIRPDVEAHLLDRLGATSDPDEADRVIADLSPSPSLDRPRPHRPRPSGSIRLPASGWARRSI